jgi:N-acetylglucosamine-6-phosphate deacetylase
MKICFKNGKILRKGQIIKEDFWIENGKVIVPQLQADQTIELDEGMLIAPGYIDLQINGGFGFDFTQSLKPLEKVALKLPKFGVTAFLPTLISTSPENYRRLMAEYCPGKGATSVGLHLEGPFLSKEQSGAHEKQFFRDFSERNSLENCYGSLSHVKMITLAPELPHALSYISELNSRGILVAAGHSQASYEIMQASSQAGLKMSTHLFNAMVPFHHRNPGMIAAALTLPRFFYSIIADGIHCHPAALRLAWQANPKGLILISDGMAALGQGDGHYQLGGKEVSVQSNRALIVGTTRIAGSVLPLDAAVRNFRDATGCSIVEAIEAATLKPAQVLGLTSKGHLEIGADADFNLLDENLKVQCSYVLGIEYKTK